MQPKEQLTGVVASSLNFESFPENFTFAFKTQMVKNVYSQSNILPRNELQGSLIKEGSCKDILKTIKVF